VKIPISKPYFGPEERELVQQPLETGWVVQGPYVKQFEEKFANYTGIKYAAATTSCTTALHLAMVAFGVGPGDEVILPSFTWVATANVVEMQGARPIFIDIDLETFNIDVLQIEQAITAHTKVIIPVSLFGLSADMKPILEIAHKYQLKVVEDDACGIGAWYHGFHAGALADIACFSFHPRKSITTGEGGMLVTNDDQIDVLVRSLRDHGASKSDLARHMGARSYILPDFNMVGYNYRMTDLQGAVGSAQMDRLRWILEQKRRLALRYDQEVSKLGWLRPPITPLNYVHGYQAYVCLFQPEEPTLGNVIKLNKRRNEIMDRLEAAGVSTRPGTHAVHMLSYYREKYGIKPQDYPNAYLADQLTITLPLYPQMTEEEQDYIIETLREAF
jgi:perosamine synthetase